MSELEFLGALRVELARRRGVGHGSHPHELFQASTVEALLGGAFDGDLTVGELLEHGDLGLGTLNALDGELIVIDGQAWRADLDCNLLPASSASRTPYAVVVPFSAREPIALSGPLDEAGLERQLVSQRGRPVRPVAARIEGEFDVVRVRSVPRQKAPYPTLAQAIADQRVCELTDVAG
ncbi:MAG TPA: acetolactate decarboxylase, partial [Solirubrobacteraceae bacterium]